MDIKKFFKERIKILSNHEAYLIVSKNKDEKVSGYRNSISRFMIKELDSTEFLVYKCRVRFARSIEEAKDSGRIHMLIDQFLTEEECEKFFPEVMKDLKAIKKRKLQKTLENEENRKKNLRKAQKKEELREIRRLTRGRSIRESAKDSI